MHLFATRLFRLAPTIHCILTSKITGRVDDVINTKGHRLGTAELESIMVKRDKLP